MSDGGRGTVDGRPTAEEMLARIGTANGERERGRLRVYLGMAPGVGKTYRMLEEGHRRTARGTDLVVGFVEAHGRPETDEAPRRAGDRPAAPGRVSRCRGRGDGHRRDPRASPDRCTGRRARPHERARLGADEALGRRQRPARCRHRRRQHLQHPAPRFGRRRRRDDHRRPGQRADPRRGPRGRRRGRARRHEPVRAPPADAPRQRLSAGSDRRSRSTGSSPSRT